MPRSKGTDTTAACIKALFTSHARTLNDAIVKTGLSRNSLIYREKRNIPIDKPRSANRERQAEGSRNAAIDRWRCARTEAAAIAAAIDARKVAIKAAQAAEPTEGDDD